MGLFIRYVACLFHLQNPFLWVKCKEPQVTTFRKAMVKPSSLHARLDSVALTETIKTPAIPLVLHCFLNEDQS